MINFKQLELGRILFEKLNQEFPEIELVSITESAENPNDIWVNVIMPDDEDREILLREMASEISTHILLEHGYYIAISSATNLEKTA